MAQFSLSELHQKLNDYGVKMEVLSKLSTQEAIHLLNYKTAKMTATYSGYQSKDFVNEIEQDNTIEQLSKGI